MKKLIATSLLIAALTVSASSVSAEESLSCQSQGQYGGGVVCGVSTSTETTVTHLAGTGVADWTLAQIIAFAGVSAVAATLLYKATYRLYIFG